MRNDGVTKPVRNAAICGAIAVSGYVALYLGVRSLDPDTLEAGNNLAMVYGLLASVLGTALFFNFMRAVTIFRRMRSGQTAIARWTVSPSDHAKFRLIDSQFRERGFGNDYKPPVAIAKDGLEVIFADDAVLIGDSFFNLASTGISRIGSVEFFDSDPPVLAFGTAMTTASHVTHLSIRTHRGQLRVPVATNSRMEARKLKDHFQSILEGRTIVNPDFWTRRIKGGLFVAALAAIAAATGFALAERNQELNMIPLVLAVSGTIIALAGMFLALIAYRFRQRQHGL